MRPKFTASLLAAFAVLSLAAAPTPPRNPIVIETVVGTAATVTGKVEVVLAVTITKTATTPTVTLNGIGIGSGTIPELSVADLANIGKALKLAGEYCDAGKAMEAVKIGDVAVSAEDFKDKFVVRVGKKDVRAGLYLPAEDADRVADALDKAATTWDWMKDRVAALQK